MFDLDRYKKVCAEEVQNFKDRVLPFPYINSGISPHEAFAWCALAVYAGGVDVILESGVAGGASTEMFAKFFPDALVIGVDNAETYGKELHEKTVARLSSYPNIKIITGDSFKVMPRLLNEYKGKRIGLFFDGPKGIRATELAQQCFQSRSVKMYGQHDTCTKDKYHCLDHWDKAVMYSDAPWFKELYGDLDGQAFAGIQNGGMGLALND